MSSRFSIRQARSLVSGLSHPNATIYWFDFMVTICLGHALFVAQGIVAFGEPNSAMQWISRLLLFAATSLLYMRAAMFIHELVHLPRRQFKGFRIAWNALCGIPFLIPSFLYYPHVEHHRRKHYGTAQDGEYLDLSHRHPAELLVFVLAAFVVPVAAFARFALFSPLSWLVPSFGAWVERRASSMIIDIFFVRGDYGRQAKRVMRIQEVACFAWCAGIVANLFLSPQVGGGYLVQGYALAVTLVLINNIRTLGAHRWTGDGRELSFEEQLLDSVNYPYRPWITELWGPTGTRYHALHHLFPSIPYHNLGIAHRRLMAGLPPDSPYRETERVTLLGAIWELWQRAANRKLCRNHSGDSSAREPKAA